MEFSTKGRSERMTRRRFRASGLLICGVTTLAVAAAPKASANPPGHGATVLQSPSQTNPLTIETDSPNSLLSAPSLAIDNTGSTPSEVRVVTENAAPSQKLVKGAIRGAALGNTGLDGVAEMRKLLTHNGIDTSSMSEMEVVKTAASIVRDRMIMPISPAQARDEAINFLEGVLLQDFTGCDNTACHAGQWVGTAVSTAAGAAKGGFLLVKAAKQAPTVLTAIREGGGMGGAVKWVATKGSDFGKSLVATVTGHASDFKEIREVRRWETVTASEIWELTKQKGKEVGMEANEYWARIGFGNSTGLTSRNGAGAIFHSHPGAKYDLPSPEDIAGAIA